MTSNSREPSTSTKTGTKDPQLWRDLTAFWLIGICVDYGFHMMLVAANDLLSDDPDSQVRARNSTFNSHTS